MDSSSPATVNVTPRSRASSHSAAGSSISKKRSPSSIVRSSLPFTGSPARQKFGACGRPSRRRTFCSAAQS
jgi:hypothetical protein